jgi:hypothetical protein
MALTPFQDFLREPARLDLTMERRVEIPIFVVQTVAGQISATYKIPGNMRLALTSMRGRIAGAGITSVDTALVQALNCRLTIFDQDAQLYLTERGSSGNYLRLADILSVAGGLPVDWSVYPWILPPAHTIQVQSTLDVNPGAAGEFGVVLSGVLVDAGIK